MHQSFSLAGRNAITVAPAVALNFYRETLIASLIVSTITHHGTESARKIVKAAAERSRDAPAKRRKAPQDTSK